MSTTARIFSGRSGAIVLVGIGCGWLLNVAEDLDGIDACIGMYLDGPRMFEGARIVC